MPFYIVNVIICSPPGSLLSLPLQKLGYFSGESEERYADDLLRVYGYEGEGSPAGSVGCCSELGDQDNLDFLDSLGSKFKTLANICTEKEEEE